MVQMYLEAWPWHYLIHPPPPPHMLHLWYSHCTHIECFMWTHCQVRARRVLSIFKDVPLRTRRVLLPYTFYSNSALLVLNRTSLDIDSSLLAFNWQYVMSIVFRHRNVPVCRFPIQKIFSKYLCSLCSTPWNSVVSIQYVYAYAFWGQNV